MSGGGARLVADEQGEGNDHDETDGERGQTHRAGQRGEHTSRVNTPMDALAECSSDQAPARERLIAELREHALVIGAVTLTSGAQAEYYVDAKRAILRPAGFAALAALVAWHLSDWEATAVGGMTMGADPVACAGLAGGARAKAFFVRKETKAHGLQRRIEGPPLMPEDRCVVVEDVVTTGGSTLAAIQALHDAGQEICGVLSVLDRLAGGGTAIERAAGAPYVALTTIDDVYPDRPDRQAD
jgi:orotate phosphoribosyltransferase